MYSTILTKQLQISLLLVLICLTGLKTSAQTTTVLSYGFETADATWTYNQTTGITLARANNNANTGTWSAFYDGANGAGSRINGSVITPSLTFNPGYIYTVSVFAKTNATGIVTGQNPVFKIARATTATNAAMSAATGADLLLNTTLTSASYGSAFTATFSVTSNTTRFIGFHASSGVNSVDAWIDDVLITRTCNISANAGTDQINAATCGLTQVTLAGNTLPTGASGMWTVASGTGGSFGNASSPTSTFTGTSGNEYTLQWTVSLGTCTNVSDQVNVNLNTAPVIGACPGDIVQCDNNVATWTNPTATGTPTPAVNCSPASGSTFNVGTTTVTCTATNICGSSSCSFSVTINTSAAITCPSDIVACNPVVTFAPTVGGSPAPSVSCTPASGSTFALGTTQVNCSAANSCNTSTCSFNVTVNEAPVIGACPSDIIQCDNNIATWTDPTSTGTPAATVTCVPASGSTFTNGVTVVTCTATNSCGSSSCSFNVSIGTTPTVEAGLAQTICYTGTATMNGSIGGGATSATWSTLGDGSFDDVNLLNAIYTPGPNDITNGSATLVLTSDFQGSCVAASDQVNLTIIYAPTSQPGIVTGATPACPGNTITFSIAPVAGATSYTWSSVDATTTIVNGQGTTIADILFGNLPTGQSTYPLSVVAVNQCGNSTPRTFAPRGKISQPTFSGASPSVICPNTNAVTFSVAPVSGAASYAWTITGSGATINGPSNGTSISVDFGTFTSVTINVTASNACMTTLARTKTISSTPSVPGTLTGQSYPCPGGTYTYSVAPVAGALTYNWSGPAGSVVSGNSNSVSITFGPAIPAGSTIKVSAEGSCNNISTQRIKGVASGIPNIPSNISGAASGQCGQTGVSYSVVPNSNQPLASSYLWSVNNGASISGPNNLSAISVDFPPTFTNVTLSVVAINSCGSSISRNLVVNAAPGMPASISGNGSPCAGTVETYCAAGTAGATNYVWTVPTGWTVMNISPPCITVFTGSSSGNVTSRAANACGMSSAKSKPVTISCRLEQVMQTKTLSDVQLYPNPAKDKTTLKFNNEQAGDYTISLIETTGRVVYNSTGVALEGENLVELNLADYAKGIYMMQMIRNGEQQMLRLVVE